MAQIVSLAIFCDDIREEMRGTETIVGAYPSNISVPNFPGQLERFSLYIRTHVPTGADVGDIRIALTMPDGAVTDLSTMPSDFVRKAQQDASDNGFPFAILITRVSFPTFVVAVAGVVLVSVACNEGTVVAGMLNFHHTPQS